MLDASFTMHKKLETLSFQKFLYFLVLVLFHKLQ